MIKADINEVRRRLASKWHSDSLTRNTKNIRSRLDPGGYFPESLTGKYDGMFPRTVGALAKLFLLTGELEALAQCVEYVLRTMADASLERMPHKIVPRSEAGASPLCDMLDEIDGQAHLILAWALLAAAKKRCTDEDRRWPLVRDLMDRSVESPYLSRDTCWRIHPGLVLNLNLEHSRDEQLWLTYDFLSQSFIAAALEAMIDVADRRGEEADASRWRGVLASLTASIEQKMVYELDGKPVYREMLLPSGRKPVPFEGMGWINLAPIPSGWEGVNREIFGNTLRAWHARAKIEWGGPAITACDWTPAGHTNQTYGKMLGWDLAACMDYGEYGHVCSILDFLEQVNTAGLYAEIFNWHPDLGEWTLHDAGNGEQVVWLCWSLMRVRQLAGLSPEP
ncbi:MAG: hypothetical protein KAR36_08065 [Candidatus Latescibacteria bacterium]|nr:hypothetical protein [Candidatus Latescibacterota bacterium]